MKQRPMPASIPCSDAAVKPPWWALVLCILSLFACGGRGAPAAPPAHTGPAARAALAGRPAQPPPTAAELERIDIYGSRQVTREEILARWGQELVELMRGIDRGEDVSALFELLRDELPKREQVAYAAPGAFTFDDGTYVVLDLVDKADWAGRALFAPAPTKTLPDPDGLIALWLQYEEKFRELQGRGELQWPVERCRFWHCLARFEQKELAPFGEEFARRVPAAEAALAEILTGDRRAEHRAAAAYLLAHLTSGPRVVELLLPAMRDPHELIRNNATRVLGMIAERHPEVEVPAEPFLQAFELPQALDRNKALYGLLALLQHHDSPALRQRLHQRSCARLVDMLELRLPNNRTFAHEILKRLAGRDLGKSDVAAWRGFCAAPPRTPNG